MTDQRNSADAPLTPGASRVPMENPNSEINWAEPMQLDTEEDKDKYINQLQRELQDLRGRMIDMEQHQLQSVSVPNNQNVPPGFPVPSYSLAPRGLMPQPPPAPFYYPNQTPVMYAYPAPIVLMTNTGEGMMTNVFKTPISTGNDMKGESSCKKKKRRQPIRDETRINRGRWCDVCRTTHLGLCSIHTRRCLCCGVIGHEAKTCSYQENVCWNCQLVGHRAAQCPYVIRFSSGSGSRAGTETTGDSSSSAAGQKRKNPSYD